MKNKVIISSETFWKYANKIYPINIDWHLRDPSMQIITREKTGLEFVETIFADLSDNTNFVFKIVDKKKYTFAKIKYGI